MLRKSLGLNPDQTTTAIASDLDHLASLGVQTLWLVLAVEWAFPTSTTMDSTIAAKYDAAVTGAVSRGMSVAIQAHGMPTWITTASGHTANTWHGPDTAGERTSWVACLHSFLNRYAAGTIGWVECWNEPNLTEFWVQGYNPADYARLLHDTYVDIKATWPAIKVVGHNMSRNHLGWLFQHYAWSDSIYGAGTSAANDYWFDVLGIHPYCGNSTSGYAPSDNTHADETHPDFSPVDPNYLGYRRLYDMVVDTEGAAKPLAFGEFGYATMGSGFYRVTEAERAAYIVQALNLANTDDYVDYLTVFYERPAETPTDYATSYNIHGTSTEVAFAGALTGTSAPGAAVGYFDGVRRPLLQVLAGFGGALDPGADYIHLGVGPGLGTGKLSGPGAGTNEIDITADVRSISLSQRGRTTDIDAADPVTCTIVLSNRHGNYDPSNPGSPYAGQLEDGTPVRVRATWQDVAYDRFYGELAGITLDLDVTPDATVTFTCLDGLEKLGRAYLPQVNPTMDNQRTGIRIGLLADQAEWSSSLRTIETGYTTLGRTVLGETALELMHAAESTEFGLLFADGGGRIVFYDRHHPTTATRSITVQATFADTAGAGKVGFQTLALSRNRDRTFNRVAITRQAAPDEPYGGGGLDEPIGDTPVEQVADDPVTRATKGILAFPAEVGQLLRNDSEALAMAQYLVGRFAVIANHIREIQVNALRGGWDVLFPLGPLDRVAVSRDYGPNTVAVELHVQGVAEEIQANPPSWQMTFSTTNPPTPSELWLVGSSQVGVDSLGW
jgi:Cellulase (glycosyl hydrolase family 5)